MIYLYIFIALTLLLVLEKCKGLGRVNLVLQWVFLIGCILFIGLRNKCGPDYFSYQGLYSFSAERSFLEPFFVLVMNVFNGVHASYTVFLLFIAILSITIKTYVIQKYSPYFFLSVLIAFPTAFLSDMGQIRFSLSFATLWLSIPFLMERNLKGYLVVMALAVSMHYSSLVFLPVYWLNRTKINVYLMFGIWAVCYALSFTKFEIWFANWVFDAGIDEFSTKTEIYMEDEREGQRYGVSLFGLLSKILVMVLLYFTNLREEDKLQRILLNIYFIGGCFFFLFSFNETFGTRFSIYFLSFEALAVPIALEKLQDIRLFYLLVAAFVIKALYQYYTLVYLSYPDMYLPYNNVLRNI